nr:FAD-dependent oxidoreductase [Oscillospiraceae bacterium]
MPVVVSEIKLSPDEPEEAALRRAASLFGKKPEELSLCGVSKVSVDARHKDNVRLVYSVALDFGGAKGAAEALRSGNVRFYEQAVEAIPQLPKEPEYRPVIIGFGPAGMFAGLYLARAGARPLILERGAAVEERAAAVERYWQGGP